MRGTDLFLALPGALVAIAIVGIGPSITASTAASERSARTSAITFPGCDAFAAANGGRVVTLAQIPRAYVLGSDTAGDQTEHDPSDVRLN